MTRWFLRLVAGTVVVGLLAIPDDARAGASMRVACPAAAIRGNTVTTTVYITNQEFVSLALAKGARLLHLGNTNVMGPTRIALAATIPGQSTQAFPIQFTMPTSPAVGAMVTVGYGAFGRFGRRAAEWVATEACVIEAR